MIRPSFSERSKDVAIATNCRRKITEIGLLTFILRTGIPKWIGIEYRNINGRINSNDDSSTACGKIK